MAGAQGNKPGRPCVVDAALAFQRGGVPSSERIQVDAFLHRVEDMLRREIGDE